VRPWPREAEPHSDGSRASARMSSAAVKPITPICLSQVAAAKARPNGLSV